MPAPIFIVAIILHLAAIFLFVGGRHRPALITLFTGGFILRYYIITLDRFLHEWDERFHAEVAKNLMHHWLKPTLFDQPLLPYDYHNWFIASVWLHKQPLFLWQMALSMKIFGVNEVSIRIPSLILTCILILVIYGIGKIAFSKETGFIAALLFSCYEPILQLTSGFGNTDHNDVVFICYVTISVYFWLCFEKKGSARYLWLMGFASGLAILTKWMTGLVVFASFGFYHLFLARDLFDKEIIKQLAISLLICIITFLPWQLYILSHYPQEARYEYYYNNLHFYKVVEGKYAERVWWFYLDKLKDQYKGLQYLIVIGFALCAVHWRRYKLALSLAFMSVLVYVFFSIAETKMQSFVLVAAPINILFISFVLDKLSSIAGRSGPVAVAIRFFMLAGALYLFIDYDNIYDLHLNPKNWTNAYRSPELTNMSLLRMTNASIPKEAVLVNFHEWQNVSAMFYTGHTCYTAITKDDMDLLMRTGHPVYFMGDTLPDFAKGTDAKLILGLIPSKGH